jgi:hypothetical protein
LIAELRKVFDLTEDEAKAVVLAYRNRLEPKDVDEAICFVNGLQANEGSAIG